MHSYRDSVCAFWIVTEKGEKSLQFLAQFFLNFACAIKLLKTIVHDRIESIYGSCEIQLRGSRSVRARLQSCRKISKKGLDVSPCVSLFSANCNYAAAKAGA